MSGMQSPHAPYTPRARLDFSALHNIAVFRALQLGDLLCLVPALRALRLAAPNAKITLIGLPWAQEFTARFNKYVDDFLMFPGFPGLVESTPQINLIPAFFAAAQQRQFDFAFQMHGSGNLSNPITMALGAARTAGFYLPDAYCPDHEYFIPWLSSEHEITQYLRLLEFLGAPAGNRSLEFPLQEADYQSLRKDAQFRPPPGTYVCIHPGARLQSRRWLPQRFAYVADGLAAQGWQVVLTGSANERPIVDAVLHAMRAPAIDMCGRTGLGALAAMVAGARLLVSNDTGISHIAAAVATPSVIISSGGDSQRWAPLDRRRHRVLHAAVPCRPCSYSVCPIGHPCAENISAEKVLHEALRVCADNMLHPGTGMDRMLPSGTLRIPQSSQLVKRRPGP
jgi:ADP-heptose:LPS heptosyltransferase